MSSITMQLSTLYNYKYGPSFGHKDNALNVNMGNCPGNWASEGLSCGRSNVLVK